MYKNRLFNVFVLAALVVVIALTISQAIATTKVVAASSDLAPCAVTIDRSSLTAVYINQIRFPRTADGFTGVDGGLIELLSGQRVCAR